ncbi:hypothetical protein [uncultured Amnibacterium sp.]|uniref:hypothetical protein n=1 Tax=uncultured Amnibacterium sp. TaxID=1631851 RepID=UPI0035CBF76D
MSSTTTDDHQLEAHRLGDAPVHTPDGRDTTAHLGRASVIGDAAFQPGEFDLPPAEPVVLVGDVPWELRDPEA